MARTATTRGTATAELAVVLPAVVLLAASGVWAVAAAAAQLRCVDAAGTGARALARGETTAAVSRAVAEVGAGRRGRLDQPDGRARGGRGPDDGATTRPLAAAPGQVSWWGTGRSRPSRTWASR